jgi:3-oxoacyl-[acyl-carrier-protein] synthase II
MVHRRVVITGMGLLTPVGLSVEEYWHALCSGSSGVRRLTLFDPSSLPSQIGAEVPNFEPRKLLPATMKDARKALNKMARTIQLGVCAAQQTMADGGPERGTIDPFRFGIEFGCVMVATELDDLVNGGHVSCEGEPLEVNLVTWGRDGLKRVPPLWMLKYLPNMPACHISVNYDAQGPNNTITTTDMASTLALGEALRLLDRHAADYFLVGGCDSKTNPLSASRFNSFAPLCRSKNDDPATAVRPFDRQRDGTVVGEGAAVFGVEDLEFAHKRGAKIYAEVCGFASGVDHQLQGERFSRVILNALADAKITPADVDHVNAAADGTREPDAWEARAIAGVFGTAVPVVSYKGHLGNTGAAAGLVELAASVLALKSGELPGTLNCPELDSACPIAVHTGAPRRVTKPYAVKLSRTDRGQCAAVVIKAWKEEA